MSTKVLLEEAEIDRRIAAAVAQVNTKGRDWYGVSGLGGESTQLIRTGRAAGVTLNIVDNEDDSNLKEFVLSDATMQAFFNFPKHTDSHGNVFVTIRPLSFRIDRKSNGEVQAISVKEYEQGDEELGFELHPAFKKWTSNTEYNGYGNLEVAVYLSACYDTDNEEVYEGDVSSASDISVLEVNSKSGLSYVLSYATWQAGMQVIKQTDASYNMFHVNVWGLFKDLAYIYLATTDPWGLVGVDKTNGDAESDMTGETDGIVSHSGFNASAFIFKLFNIDNFFAPTVVNGIYNTHGNNIYFANKIDTDASSDTDYIKSSIPFTFPGEYGSEEYDIVTKVTRDAQNFALSLPTAYRPIENNRWEEPDIYYASGVEGYEPSQGNRGQIYSVFNYGPTDGHFGGIGIEYSGWVGAFVDAWYDCTYALRLCKAPI